MELEASKVKGLNVMDSRGMHIGDVDDLVFNPQTWSVEAVVVNLTREAADDLNVKRPVMGSARLSVSPQRINTVGDAILLNVNRDDLAGLLRGVGGAETTGTESGTGPRTEGTIR